jgi:hypothetical protein
MNITVTAFDWAKLGRELRQNAEDVHAGMGFIPSASFAYQFLLDNPECFGCEEWPEDMPSEAPEALVTAFYSEAEHSTREGQ